MISGTDKSLVLSVLFVLSVFDSVLLEKRDLLLGRLAGKASRDSTRAKSSMAAAAGY